MVKSLVAKGVRMHLHSFFPYRLAITAEAFSRHLTEVYQREFNFSREEWRLLFLLANAHSLSSLELSKRTSLDKVQVSRAADRLEKKQLILRETSPQDRRLRQYTCTAQGQSLFNRAFQLVNARADTILERMSSEDRAALDQGLSALARVTQAEIA